MVLWTISSGERHEPPASGGAKNTGLENGSLRPGIALIKRSGTSADPMANNGDTKSGSGLTYKDSGVDIDAGEALVMRIVPAARATRRPGADADLGGFGGLFDLKAAGFKDPILVV